MLPSDLSPDLLEAFLLRFQFEEVEYKLSHLEEEHSNANFTDRPLAYLDIENRQATPPEVIARSLLVQERRQILTSIEKIYPIFRQPLSPQISRLAKRFAEIELDSSKSVSLLMGPRGNTVRSLEKEFNVTISIGGSQQPPSEGAIEGKSIVMILGAVQTDIDRCSEKIRSLLESEIGGRQMLEERLPVDQMRLGFDPLEEVYPWRIDNSSIEKGGLDEAFTDLMADLASGGRQQDEQTAEREGLLRRFEVDLCFRDISSVLLEPPPPGTE